MDKDCILAIIFLVLGLPGPIWAALRIWNWNGEVFTSDEAEEDEELQAIMKKERKTNIGMIVYGVLALIGIVIAIVILK